MPSIRNVDHIRIGTSSTNYSKWTGITDVSWEEADTWVRLSVPKGKMKYQDILPYEVSGKITCINYDSMYNTLFKTNIGLYGFPVYPINESDMRKVKVPYTAISLFDTKIDNKIQVIEDFRVSRINITSIVGKPSSSVTYYIINFYSSKIVPIYST